MWALMPLALFNVTLTDCLLGFRYDPEKQSCVCESIFAAFSYKCRAESGTITLNGNLWVGQVKDGNKSLLGSTRCAPNYCNAGTLITKDFNQQCNDSLNREGVGCGQCKANYSSTFGSNQCQECLNHSLFLIILTGLGTMVLLSFLRISIAEGYLNGINDLFASFFVPLNTLYAVVFVPLFWISQNLGIQACSSTV